MEVLDQEHYVADAPMQCPPLINRDQKAGNGGLHRKVDEKDVEDNKGVMESNNKNVCKIDVKNDDACNNYNNEEKVCRICQLSSDNLPKGAGNINLVHLGCNCKGELGISHYHCAVLWFQHKGNRTCEICGKPAKNIAGIEDTEFRAYGTDIGVITTAVEIARMSSAAHESAERRWTKSLCNFLLVAIVLAFLLPWALHRNKLL